MAGRTGRQAVLQRGARGGEVWGNRVFFLPGPRGPCDNSTTHCRAHNHRAYTVVCSCCTVRLVTKHVLRVQGQEAPQSQTRLRESAFRRNKSYNSNESVKISVSFGPLPITKGLDHCLYQQIRLRLVRAHTHTTNRFTRAGLRRLNKHDEI
jgi:hypothetical protein